MYLLGQHFDKIEITMQLWPWLIRLLEALYQLLVSDISHDLKKGYTEYHDPVASSPASNLERLGLETRTGHRLFRLGFLYFSFSISSVLK
jgi:hypothetical protein